MNLYIINEVLYDYTPGMCVIAAESMAQCRKFFIDEFCDADDFDHVDTKFTIINGVDREPGIVSYVYGGG
jgi:hypothetical protein